MQDLLLRQRKKRQLSGNVDVSVSFSSSGGGGGRDCHCRRRWSSHCRLSSRLCTHRSRATAGGRAGAVDTDRPACTATAAVKLTSASDITTLQVRKDVEFRRINWTDTTPGSHLIMSFILPQTGGRAGGLAGGRAGPGGPTDRPTFTQFGMHEVT